MHRLSIFASNKSDLKLLLFTFLAYHMLDSQFAQVSPTM